MDGGDADYITWTTVKDVVHVVVQAIEFEGAWPVIGGIRGTTLSVGELIALGEEIRSMLGRSTCDAFLETGPTKWY